jgi:uncharacterized protein YndB with AHSA1/START domain
VGKIKQQPSGHRVLEMEFDLPGTPEQVWQAIATGPGITSWFVDTQVEERKGGKVVFNLGPDMTSTGEVTVWEPNRRVTYVEPDWNPPAPPLATEFIIEAQAGGKCKVRLVHSLFTTQDTWDNELEGMEKGWPPFFQILQRYLAHFPGMRAAVTRIMVDAPGTVKETWDAIAADLQLKDLKLGQQRTAAAPGLPPLTGVVDRLDDIPHCAEVMLVLDEPTPGVALFGAYAWGGKTHCAINLYFYGDRAAETVAQFQPAWSAWMNQRFPQAAAGG